MNIKEQITEKQSLLSVRPQNYIQLQQGNSSARCCLQTQDSRIICSIIGPYHGIKVLQQDCEIKCIINFLNKNDSNMHEETEQDIILKRDLVNMLSEIVNIKQYPKSILQLTFDIIQVNGPVFPYLVNVACFALSLAGIQILDIFSSAYMGFIGNNLIIDPSDKEFALMNKKLCIVQMKNSQKIIYLDMNGSLDFEEIQKLLSLGISGCNKISTLMSTLLIEQNAVLSN
ncbi:3' exoribonuclease family 1 protein (macronuclear) [Tetrahymena thermophila SB210]|uniref:3' exoribonuclease family 1 protein n=1 Tax=Tetrahymena thermophila (strain SB210) TaxID=312017 RepID=I7LZU1_TETTS|nr:3' exoribonuclease family 1 protein [Tetrahymena thermophila SB210]EAR84917.3 3' exoribonuclease family 1 protein [Tetrahymena thermophila SB210]|eukprot:XP_001032580.3 3' exoribonuclease family 1 protein [Tetrahymena thermophila SB210]